MDTSYWYKQASGQSLFPDLLWSRPENRQLAGKLLIISGNQYGFAAAGEAFLIAQRAGIGIARVLLPDALQKIIGRAPETSEFAPSTPSGSFSQKALSDFMIHSAWADAVLLAGDLGRNSETAILLEKFAASWKGKLILTKDAADYMIGAPEILLHRPETTMVISMAQLQKLAIRARFRKPFTFGMDLLRLVESLHDFTAHYAINIIVKHLNTITAACNGDICTTRLSEDLEIWRVRAAAYASVWLVQNASRPFAALSTAVYECCPQPAS